MTKHNAGDTVYMIGRATAFTVAKAYAHPILDIPVLRLESPGKRGTTLTATVRAADVWTADERAAAIAA